MTARRRLLPAWPEGDVSTQASRIVLSWLIRLRWLAATGQIFAITLAVRQLGLTYPLVPLATVIGATLITNAFAEVWLRLGKPVPATAAPAVLLADVLLLTALLYFTGGTENPFDVLYAVHVALAATVLSTRWAWTTVAVVAGCYSVLLLHHYPFAPQGVNLPGWAARFGEASAQVLVVALIAYFIGRVRGSLQHREHELAAVRERAQINERLAAVTTLAAGAAHELGTPLATIAVVAKEMELAARERDVPELAEDAALVRQQVERCREILEHLRGDVAGRTTDEPGRCDPLEIIDNLRDTLGPDRGRRIDVETSRVPDVAAPARAVLQALQMVANNAFDAGKPDDRVSLRIAASDDGAGVDFRLRDHGTGMDESTLRRAVDPFFTTKDPGRGMGLGLFLVRIIAERNGGSLTLTSEPEQGTVATLSLPAIRS